MGPHVVEELIEVFEYVAAGLTSETYKVAAHNDFVPRLEIRASLQVEEEEVRARRRGVGVTHEPRIEVAAC